MVSSNSNLLQFVFNMQKNNLHQSLKPRYIFGVVAFLCKHLAETNITDMFL